MTHLNHIEANWEMIKNQIHNKWNNLSLSEIEKAGNDFQKLLKLIKQKNTNEYALEVELAHILKQENSKTLRHTTNLYDFEFEDIDDEAMTSIDSHSADYSGFGLPIPESNEIETSPHREIELPIRPNTIEIGNEKNNEPNITPDETIKNLSPLKNNFL